MKKLNRKGFTLIELLAVIVIMAIILVVTVPTILNSIADARINSIWNLSVATANSYDTMATQDLIATNKVLSGNEATSNWTCITPTQAALFDLSESDVNIATEATDFGSGFEPNPETGVVTLKTSEIQEDTCSAIRIKTNGSAEVLLIAKDGGRFDNSGVVVYGLSTADKGATNTITD